MRWRAGTRSRLPLDQHFWGAFHESVDEEQPKQGKGCSNAAKALLGRAGTRSRLPLDQHFWGAFHESVDEEQPKQGKVFVIYIRFL